LNKITGKQFTRTKQFTFKHIGVELSCDHHALNFVEVYRFKGRETVRSD